MNINAADEDLEQFFSPRSEKVRHRCRTPRSPSLAVPRGLILTISGLCTVCNSAVLCTQSWNTIAIDESDDDDSNSHISNHERLFVGLVFVCIFAAVLGGVGSTLHRFGLTSVMFFLSGTTGMVATSLPCHGLPLGQLHNRVPMWTTKTEHPFVMAATTLAWLGLIVASRAAATQQPRPPHRALLCVAALTVFCGCLAQYGIVAWGNFARGDLRVNEVIYVTLNSVALGLSALCLPLAFRFLRTYLLLSLLTAGVTSTMGFLLCFDSISAVMVAASWAGVALGANALRHCELAKHMDHQPLLKGGG